jgi:restriction system protein
MAVRVFSFISHVVRRASASWAKAPLVIFAIPAATTTVLAYDGHLGTGRVHELALWVTAVLVALVVLGLAGAAPHRRAETLRRSGIAEIDGLSGVEFEHRLKSLYEYLGYEVETTATSGDFGADLVLVKDGERSVLQAKRYAGRVGLESVQQAVGALAHYGASKAVVASNSYFTKAARQLAASNNVELIDRDRLTMLLLVQTGDVEVATGSRLLVAQVASGVGPAIRCLVSLLGLGVRIVLGGLRVGLALWR